MVLFSYFFVIVVFLCVCGGCEFGLAVAIKNSAATKESSVVPFQSRAGAGVGDGYPRARVSLRADSVSVH